MRCANCHAYLNAERPGAVFETDTMTHGKLTTPLHDSCRKEWFVAHPPTLWIMREKVTRA